MRNTKIVATLGPATTHPEVIEKLIRSGLDVARLNFSHGTHEEHRRRIETVRETAKKLGRSVACLQDLSGPKIRTGPLSDPGGVVLETGSTFTLTTDDVVGTSARVSTTYRDLPKDARPGNRILLDDGLIEIEVEEVKGDDVITRVVNGGRLKPKKGINLPGFALSTPALTAKDRADTEFGVSLDVDYMALSFVRTANDVRELRQLLESLGRADIPIIAKIEKPEALENFDSILDVADGVMVARGDLGVEIAVEKVPLVQKDIISRSNRRGKLVITATQMLESMVHRPRPTRAEASDVANAILDGTDAIMLSAETAVGDYPTQAVSTMSRIAEYTEARHEPEQHWKPSDLTVLERASIPRAIAGAACRAADELNARFIVVFTESGATARLVSHFRPERSIIGLTPSESVYRRLALPWGIIPMNVRRFDHVRVMVEECTDHLWQDGHVAKGDVVVIVCGSSPVPGATNMINVHRF
jgi:pyruvate kinase